MKKNIIYGLIVAFIVFFVIIFRINDSLIFHSDFARDLFNILKISQGDHTLLGPKLSFGGLYTASYYYYLFVPVFLLSGFQIMSTVYFNALLFVLAIFYFFINASKKYSLWKVMMASLSISIIPIFLFASRNPSISNTHLALLLIFLTFVYFNLIERPFIILIIGFFFGVIINFGFLNLLLLLPIYLLIVYKLKKKINSLFFLFGIALSFTPLVLFEIKNNFIMIRNTFFNQSYLSWIGNNNIIHGAAGKKNIIENFFYLSNKISELIIINPIFGLAIFSFVNFFEKKLNKNNFYILNGFLALLILSVLIRFQLAPHYLYPTAFFVFFTIVILLLESQYKILIFIMFFLEIILFPKYIYYKSTIRPEPFDQAVKYSIENHLVEKKSLFNVVMIADPNAIVGFDYRYFFQKYGFVPLSEFEYSKSDILLIFTQKNNLNPSTLNSWEVEQFGKKYLLKTSKNKTGETYIFKAEKK
ncbi:MAG: hypothetical protein WC894_02195 [Patescibacteria group bacterium]